MTRQFKCCLYSAIWSHLITLTNTSFVFNETFCAIGYTNLIISMKHEKYPFTHFFPNFEDKSEHHYIGGGMNLKSLIVLIGPGCWSRSGWECDRPWIWVVGISIYRQLASQPPLYRSPHLFLVHLCVIGATMCVECVCVRVGLITASEYRSGRRFFGSGTSASLSGLIPEATRLLINFHENLSCWLISLSFELWLSTI